MAEPKALAYFMQIARFPDPSRLRLALAGGGETFVVYLSEAQAQEAARLGVAVFQQYEGGVVRQIGKEDEEHFSGSVTPAPSQQKAAPSSRSQTTPTEGAALPR